jgi:hypothetical protein
MVCGELNLPCPLLPLTCYLPPPGNRASFRTDAAISNSRLGPERALKAWVPEPAYEIDGSLEKSSGGAWDQFAENERLFGLKTDYDENIYTTSIDKSHPQYKDRLAAAERKAREIERTAPTTSHVAEERVMDFVGGEDQRDEEDKYVKYALPRLGCVRLTPFQVQRCPPTGLPALGRPREQVHPSGSSCAHRPRQRKGCPS